jgi:hypothetical protein
VCGCVRVCFDGILIKVALAIAKDRNGYVVRLSVTRAQIPRNYCLFELRLKCCTVTVARKIVARSEHSEVLKDNIGAFDGSCLPYTISELISND